MQDDYLFLQEGQIVKNLIYDEPVIVNQVRPLGTMI